MFLRRATAPASRREPALGSRRAAPTPWWVVRQAAWSVGAAAPLLGTVAVLAGCGAPNPRILEATEEARGMPSTELGAVMTEHDKIQALLGTIRSSKHVFVHDGIERDGPATAEKLQLLLERDPTGVRSAREFIDRIAAPERTDQDFDSDRVARKLLGEHAAAAVTARDRLVKRISLI